MSRTPGSHFTDQSLFGSFSPREGRTPHVVPYRDLNAGLAGALGGDDLADFIEQQLCRVGLLQKFVVLVLIEAAFEENGARVARGEDHRSAGMLFDKTLEEFGAAHPWHHHIGKEQIELTIILLGDLQGFDSIARGEDVEAVLAQDEIGEFAQDFFVLGEQNDRRFAADAEVTDRGGWFA